MTLAQFIQGRKERWQQLDTLLATIQTRRLRALNRSDLKRLGQLYRAVASDLAFAQTNFPQSDVAQMLNELAARTHPFVYRARSLTPAGVWQFFRNELPELFRRNFHYFSLSALIFGSTAILGAIATLLNEEVAGIILDPRLIEMIHRREMWTEKIFSILPGSILSVAIFTNNITVAFMTFTLGMTFGVGTCYVLAVNGLMLGCVITLCWHYGMLDKLLGFVVAHGIVEISIILLAGAAGLMLGSALMNPGEYSRRDALAVRGNEAVQLVLGTVPLLVIIGLVEAYVSPQPAIPAAAKMALGLALGALFYAHLLLGSRLHLRDTRVSSN
jgi:uncharacterized membrane protein SpoIIM required for sporulation